MPSSKQPIWKRFKWLFWLEGWDKLPYKALRFIKVFSTSFYLLFAIYFVTLGLVGGATIVGTQGGNTSFLEGIVTAVAGLTSSVSVIDPKDITFGSYLIIFLFMILGTPSLLACVPVWIRYLHFKNQKRLLMKATGQQSSSSNRDSSNDISTSRISTYSTSPLISGNTYYRLMEDADSQFGTGAIENQQSIYDLPIAASWFLGVLLLCYWATVQVIGIIILGFYFQFNSSAKQSLAMMNQDPTKVPADQLNPYNVDPRVNHVTPWWFVAFHVVSSFSNCGFSMFGNGLAFLVPPPGTNATVHAFPLIVLMILIAIGNTLYPVVLHFLLKALFKIFMIAGKYRWAEMTHIVLNESRDIMYFLFPFKETVLLLLAWIILTTAQILMWLMEWHNPATLGPFPNSTKVLIVMFEVVSARTAGIPLVNYAAFKTGHLAFIAVAIYISATPLIYTQQNTAAKNDSPPPEMVQSATISRSMSIQADEPVILDLESDLNARHVITNSDSNGDNEEDDDQPPPSAFVFRPTLRMKQMLSTQKQTTPNAPVDLVTPAPISPRYNPPLDSVATPSFNAALNSDEAPRKRDFSAESSNSIEMEPIEILEVPDPAPSRKRAKEKDAILHAASEIGSVVVNDIVWLYIACLLITSLSWTDGEGYWLATWFEVLSAYATCGLSFGALSPPNSGANFTASMTRLGQICMVCVMIVGRLRQFPLNFNDSSANFLFLWDDPFTATQQPLLYGRKRHGSTVPSSSSSRYHTSGRESSTTDRSVGNE